MADFLEDLHRAQSDPLFALLLCFGAIGTIVFNARFYVQWYASERAKRSVVPVSFWYLSSMGAIILLLYSFYEKSANGGLSYSLNTVIYSRNLVHIWRDKGTLTRARSIAFQTLVALITVLAVIVVVWIWLHKITVVKPTATTWIWIAVGVAGQALFASRFLIQWIATERKQKSVMPDIFWYISLLATILLSSSFAAQHEWLLAIGPLINLPVYLRNIWFIRTGRGTSGGFEPA